MYHLHLQGLGEDYTASKHKDTMNVYCKQQQTEEDTNASIHGHI
jgi:hypothetical protein